MANFDDAQFQSLIPRIPGTTETALADATWTALVMPDLGSADRFWVRFSLGVACQVRIGATPANGVPIPANTWIELGPYAAETVLQVRQSSGGSVTLRALVERPG